MTASFTSYSDHSRRVTAWYTSRTRTMPAKGIAELCGQTFSQLFGAAAETLGAPTAEAIAERVLEDARERYAWLASVSFRDGVLDPLPKVNLSQHPEVICYLLTEFLAITSNLTGGLLTARLYKELGA